MALNLEGKISLDGSGFERGLRRASEHVTDFVKNTAIAAFGFYGVEQAIHHTVETASELVDQAERLGLTVEQVQLLQQAAKDAGTDMGTLAGEFEKVNLARFKALQGDKDAIAAFKKLGVSDSQLKTQTAASIFMGPMASTVKKGNVEDLGPALREILGKSFGQVIPTLKTDFGELGDQMNKLGTIMDTKTAIELDLAGDKFSMLSQILGAQLGPVLVSCVEFLALFAASLKTAWAFLKTAFAGKSIDKKGFWDSFFTGEKIDWKELKERAKKGEAAQVEEAGKWDELFRKMEAAIEEKRKELENPKPPKLNPDDDPNKKTAKVGRTDIPADNLVKVGNFLGSVGATVSEADQKKISLLTAQKIVLDNMFGILCKVESNTANFGTQSPIGVPL